MSKKGGKQTPSKNEKSDKRTTPTNELIPGIADAEWHLFQEVEQRDDIISELVGEIVEESLNCIVERHTSRVAVDTAVSDVLDILSAAVRLNFITHDRRPFNLTDDSAPPPTQTDSWARGRIPVVRNIGQVVESTSRVSTGVNVRFNSAKSTKSEPQSMVPSGMPMVNRSQEDIIPVTSQRAATDIMELKPNKRKFKRYTGRVQSNTLKSITTPLEHNEEALLKSRPIQKKKESTTGAPASFNTIWKVMQNRPSNKDLVQFDEDGNVKSITKLSNKALPKLQKTRPNVKITDAEIIKGPTMMKDKSREYRVASLRPVSGTTNLRAAIPTGHFELANGVTMIQAGDKLSKRPQQTVSDKDLRPMKLMQNAPLDHKAIVAHSEA